MKRYIETLFFKSAVTENKYIYFYMTKVRNTSIYLKKDFISQIYPNLQKDALLLFYFLYTVLHSV